MRYNDSPFNTSQSFTGSIGGLLAQTYALLAVTLGVSASMSYFGMGWPFAYRHPILLMMGSFALLFAVQYTGAQRSPMAIPLILLFAAGMGAMMGPSIALYLRMPGGDVILTEALGTTAAMFVGLSAYGAITKHDFGHTGGVLLTGLVVAILASLLNMIFFHAAVLQLAIAGVLVLVFSGLIIYDTQRMIDGGVREPVLIVVSLYLDILNLFQSLLEIFGSRN